jgi:HlyD family secretion protein
MKYFLVLFFLLLAAFGAFYFYQHRPIENKHEITLYGNVDVRQVDLGFRVSGRVSFMLFQEGDLVPPNTLIATLDPQPYLDELNQSKARVESSRISLDNSERLLKRRKELLGTGGISEQDYDDALSAKNIFEADLKAALATEGVSQTNLRDTELFSLSEGTVLTRIREPGTVVRPADPIYTLSLLSPIWVRAYVTERQLGEIYPGMAAEIYTDTPGSSVYKGQIGFISPVAEFTPKTVETTQLRTDLVYRLRIIAENPDHGLKQGMPVTVKLKL